MLASRGGICRDRPARLGSFDGVAIKTLSSIDLFAGSLNLGEGESTGVESEKERVLVGVLLFVLRVL